ncbi:MAG: zinc ABC transporter solute-binding protein [candidate division Zixibacteria bacterium]|nr:zinc ABC transporter solute-binding protein [candidate division Zixibacteria bacterium]
MSIKRSFQKVILFFVLLGFGEVTILSAQNQSGQLDKPKIYVSVPPLAYFVERICENDFEIVTVIRPGQSPTTYETTPKRLAQFSKAKIFFTAGVPFEKQLNKKLKNTFENLNIIDTQEGILLQELEHHHHGDAEHDDETDENDEGSLDPHTWLDPSLSKIISQNIYDGLINIYPSDSLKYQKNLNALLEDLSNIDIFIKQKLKPYPNRHFYCFHPAFGYFARAYDLHQIAIEVDGKEPSARQLSDIIKKAQKDKVEILFTQPQFSDKSARAIAESVGAKVVPIDPLSKDYLNNLKAITSQLVLAFEE